jgi:hypothetical protein
MGNRTINLDVVSLIAQALGDLNNAVVFVGGAVISIYADDPAAGEIRPTQDIDLMVKLLDLNQQELDVKLAERGFHPDSQGHAICAYKYNDIAVDIMASTDSMRGPTNRWYEVGFDSIQKVEVKGASIQILSAPCYLATKFEAYNHRGGGDYRTSHDFEDIVYVIDNRITIVDEVCEADKRIKDFLISELEKILNTPYAEEVLSAHLHPLIQENRYPILLAKINKILE